MGARTDLAGRAAEEYAANTTGVENMIAALEAVPAVGRVIFASSRMVCRIGYQPRHDSDYCPTTAYGESKVQMERIVRSRARQQVWTIVRPSSIWGPWFGVPYKDFFLAIAHGRYFHVGRRPIYKSFGYVGNTVYQLHKLLVAPATEVQRRTLYVADYPPLEVKHWAEGIRASLDAPPIRTLPYPVLRAAAMAGDVLRRAGWREVPLTRFRLDNLLTEMVYDLRPLEKIVGRLPNSLQQGTLETITWLRRQGEVPT
jgi:nucleoside-diphosphate-sugar epimerase